MVIGNLIKKYKKYEIFDITKMSFAMLQKEAEKLLLRYEKLKSKDEKRRIARESRKKACESRSKSIQKSAT